MAEVNDDASLEFKWLKKRGVGGKKKEVRFYESFIYDGVEYMLYDCVYMYKEGLQEPYIGKLTKIWENADKTKKVKLHWFFRPKEISKWLGDTKTRENEIFFASGEGVGLANISPLEAIAGKCNVVCVSKDGRNPQPSDEELKAADHIFYRTFDVGSCTILDKMDEKVGGLEIKDIFNRKEGEKGEKINTLPETSDKNLTTSSEPQTNKDVPNLVVEKTHVDVVEPSLGSWLDSKKAEKENPKISEVEKEVEIVHVHKVEANKRNKTPTESDKLHDQPLKKMKLDDKKPTKEKRVEVAHDYEKLTDIPSKKSKADNVNNQKDSGKDLETGKTKDNSKAKEKDTPLSKDKDGTKVSKKTPLGSDKLDERPLKKIKSFDKEKQVENEDNEKLKDLPSKKSKADNVNNQKDSGKDLETGKTKDNSKAKEKDTPLSKDKDETKVSKKTPLGSDKLDERPLKKIKSFDKEKQVENEDNEKLKDLPSKKSKADNVNNQKDSGKDLETGKTKDNSKVKENDTPLSKDKDGTKVSKKTPLGSDKLDERPLKKIKSFDKEKQVENEGNEKLTDLPSKKSKIDEDKLQNAKNDKGKGRDETEGRTLKKTKGEGSFKIPENKKNSSGMKLSVDTNGSNGKNLVATSLNSPVGVESLGINKEDEGKRKVSMIKSPKMSEKKTMYQEFVVGPKPNADKSGWFRRLPWDQSLKNAYDQGTAILLHNLDPDYTSEDIENLVWHAFNENCEAKILPRSAISSPHCYQALVLLKTKEAAQRVLTKLDEECLMLSNGRPLVGTTCPPIIPRKNCKFFGHLSVDKNRIMNQRELDEAVSTSHFSQPNTIEYDMAMDWCLQQSRSKKCWDMIHKQQGYELKKLEAKLAQK